MHSSKPPLPSLQFDGCRVAVGRCISIAAGSPASIKRRPFELHERAGDLLHGAVDTDACSSPLVSDIIPSTTSLQSDGCSRLDRRRVNKASGTSASKQRRPFELHKRVKDSLHKAAATCSSLLDPAVFPSTSKNRCSVDGDRTSLHAVHTASRKRGNSSAAARLLAVCSAGTSVASRQLAVCTAAD